ncbi:MAG: ABC transporter permease subunit [Sphaerobacter thermophilus]|uniref:ABC transporter permease subunit n=1 Tax=Sphaerobacter thermophilus TaxID=2057 RepID=UPI000DB2BE40|nr:MAG: hypothetical protein DIU58_02120 [Sphaerobacter thermophilus]
MASTIVDIRQKSTRLRPAIPLTATLRAEWTKLMTVRSTYVLLALSLLLSVAVTALVSWAAGWSWSEWAEADRAAFDPVINSFVGLLLATVLLVALSVGFVTSEYTSGMVRLTLTTTPRRGRVLLAKAGVIAAVTMVAGVIITVATFLTGQAVFAAYDVPTASLGDRDAALAVLATGLTTAVYPVIGVAIGYLLRRTAAAITVTLLLMFAPAFFGPLLPLRWQERVLAYLPGPATDSLAFGHLATDAPMYLERGIAAVVVAAWLVALLGAAYLVLNRRDV